MQANQADNGVEAGLVDFVRRALLDLKIPITRETGGLTTHTFQMLEGGGTMAIDVHAAGMVVVCGERGDDNDVIESYPRESVEESLPRILESFAPSLRLMAPKRGGARPAAKVARRAVRKKSKPKTRCRKNHT